MGRQLHLILSSRFDQRLKFGKSTGWWTNDQPQSPFCPDVEVLLLLGLHLLIVGRLKTIDGPG